MKVWHDHGTSRRGLRVAVAGCAALLVALSSGCGGGGGVTAPIPQSVRASFDLSGAASTQNHVRLTRGEVVGDVVTINVAITGPTASNDIYSYAFDLLLDDPDVAAYVSPTAVAGSALEPNAQPPIVVVNQIDDRVVVAVSKNGGSGNGVGATEMPIVSLDFRILKRDLTTIRIVGSPQNPIDPSGVATALDSSGGLAGVVFDDQPALLRGE